MTSGAACWLTAAAQVEGLAQTIAALRDGLVADVLVRPDVWPASPVWIGPGAEMALSEQEARDRGAARPLQDRADGRA